MKLTREVKTALLVIVAIALLVFGYSFLRGNNLLESNRTFYAVYDNVEGLAPSSKVTINGLQVGSVTDIKFLNEKGKLLVVMTIQNDFDFSKNSVAQIYGGGIIGGKSMAILPKYEGNLAKTGDTLQSDIDEGLLELVNNRLTPLQKKLESTVTSADSLLTGFNDVLDADTRKSLKNSIKQLDSTMASFNGVANSMDALLKNNKPKLDRTFTNLDETSANFNTFSDSLAQINMNKLVTDFEGVIADFQKISDDLNSGKGTAGKLLKDEAVYDNLENATKQLEELLQDIKLNPKRYVHFSVFGKNNKKYEKPEEDSSK